MKRIYGAIVASLMLSLGMTGQAFSAPAPKSVGKFQSWSAYILDEKGQKTCWIAAKPVNSKVQRPEGKATKKAEAPFKRQDVFFMVSHRPKDNVKDEVSYFLGAPAGAEPIEISIAKNKKFEMLSKQEWAWFSKKGDEKDWLKNATSVKGFTLKTAYDKGPVYYDDYSFQGFKEAADALEVACSGKDVKETKDIKKDAKAEPVKADKKVETKDEKPAKDVKKDAKAEPVKAEPKAEAKKEQTSVKSEKSEPKTDKSDKKESDKSDKKETH